MDIELRNRLWDVLEYFYWRESRNLDDCTAEMRTLLHRLWHSFFKEPVDTIPRSWYMIYDQIRKIYFEYDWNEVYDFLEFVAENYPISNTNVKFMERVNGVLKEELSAYHFVGGQITQITSEEEITEIEEALSSPHETISEHIGTALKFMSDRKSPNYRNSIKESISAVEAICKLIAHDKKAKLGQALSRIKEKIGLHEALKKAFSSYYGYTSGAEGIRHALSKESNIDFEDAKFMLVSCSAFVNYLTVKASKAGIELKLN